MTCFIVASDFNVSLHREHMRQCTYRVTLEDRAPRFRQYVDIKQPPIIREAPFYDMSACINLKG